MSDEPFGRQPKPVTVTLDGDVIDIQYWMRQLMGRAEFKGDTAQKITPSTFRIYPRAVND